MDYIRSSIIMMIIVEVHTQLCAPTCVKNTTQKKRLVPSPYLNGGNSCTFCIVPHTSELYEVSVVGYQLSILT